MRNNIWSTDDPNPPLFSTTQIAFLAYVVIKLYNKSASSGMVIKLDLNVANTFVVWESITVIADASFRIPDDTSTPIIGGYELLTDIESQNFITNWPAFPNLRMLIGSSLTCASIISKSSLLNGLFSELFDHSSNTSLRIFDQSLFNSLIILSKYLGPLPNIW